MDSIINSTFFIIPEPIYTQVKYGYLYNWYAANDVRNICAEGWHIPTKLELETLLTYMGGTTQDDYEWVNVGGALRETGTEFWEAPNSEASNSVKFNAKGSGFRHYSGEFSWASESFTLFVYSSETPNARYLDVPSNESSCYIDFGFPLYFGRSLRPIKDSTTLTHGQTGTYIGNDGKIYRTICIGTQEWLADNLAETKYRNGDTIPTVTDNSAWAALTTGAKCAYNNDESNVLIS